MSSQGEARTEFVKLGRGWARAAEFNLKINKNNDLKFKKKKSVFFKHHPRNLRGLPGGQATRVAPVWSPGNSILMFNSDFFYVHILEATYQLDLERIGQCRSHTGLQRINDRYVFLKLKHYYILLLLWRMIHQHH
jgi:hypothetical protein